MSLSLTGIGRDMSLFGPCDASCERVFLNANKYERVL
jgi:hypothetical protein